MCSDQSLHLHQIRGGAVHLPIASGQFAHHALQIFTMTGLKGFDRFANDHHRLQIHLGKNTCAAGLFAHKNLLKPL
jgi:hypothetical protein